MSDPTAPRPQEYAISCSERVREHLRALGRICRQRGDGNEFLAALQEFERRLRIYPQFGDPLSDLAAVQGTNRIGVIRPLSIRYVLIESHRSVLLGSLPVLMPKARD